MKNSSSVLLLTVFSTQVETVGYSNGAGAGKYTLKVSKAGKTFCL